LPKEPERRFSPADLQWSAGVWKAMSVSECAGVLYIALRYDQRVAHCADYVETMAMLPWLGLGEPLQHDLTRSLLSLRGHFGR
jgi:hypothetical protein